MTAPSTLSLVLRRARALPAPVLSVALNVLVVCTLVSGLAASLTLLQREALASTLAAEPADRTVLSASSPYDDEDPQRQDREVRAALQPVVEVAGGDVVTVVETGSREVVGGDADPLRFTAVSGDGGRLRASSGTLPSEGSSGTLEVAAPAGSGLAAGDTVTLRDRTDGRRLRASVTGVWSVRATDQRWLADLGPDALVVAADRVGEVAGSGTQTRWRAVPSTSALEPGDLGELADAVGSATTGLDVAATRLSTSITVDGDLLPVLADRARELTVLRALLLVPAGLLVLLVAAGLVLVAAGLADVRREEEGLLRSRGASHRQLVAPTVVETLLVCSAAALVSPLLATVVIRIGGIRPPLDWPAWLGSAVAAAACGVALTTPVLVRAVTGDRGQQQGAERQRRLALTGLLAVALLAAALGALALVTLRGFGDAIGRATGPTATVDPLLVSAPALLLAALAVVASLAALPLLFQLVDRLLATRGVAVSLGSRFAARSLGATVPLALTVTLGAGVLTFAAIERESSTAARQARADHVAAADVRVVTPPSARRRGATEEVRLLTSLPGVGRVTPVHRADGFLDDLPVETLVTEVTPSTVADLLPDPGDRWRRLVAPPWDGKDVGVAVPPGSSRLQVALEVGGRGPTEVWLADPAGRVVVVRGRWRRGVVRLALPDTGPLRLVGVRTDVAVDPEAVEGGPGARPPVARVSADGAPLAAGAHWFAPDRVVLVTFGDRPLEVPDSVPVAVTDDVAAAASLGVGDTLTLPVLGVPTQVEVAARVPAVRSVGDGAGGVLVDAGTVLPLLLAQGFDGEPDEWWLDTGGTDPDAVAVALAGHPDVAETTVTRSSVLDRLSADPSTGGTALGEVLVLTGAGCLVVGVLLLFSVMLVRRPAHAEQARRIGAAGGDRRLLVGVLSWEYVVTTGAGVLTGVLAGGVVAAVTLQSMTLGPDGDPLVPRPELMVPWPVVVAAPVTMVALPLLAMVWLTRRSHGRGLGALEGGRTAR